MVLIREFRIVMPFTINEYQLGQRFNVARMSNNETNDSTGVELLESKPHMHTEESDTTQTPREGRYSRKVYHIGSKLPGWLRAVAPASAQRLDEEAWDVYPYCKTALTSPFLGSKFECTIETRHTSGELGQVENIHNLKDKRLKKRRVEYLDLIDNTIVDKQYYKKEDDPTLFSSPKFGRGPLSKGWQKNSKDVMCCYKLVTVRCKVFGLQSRVESYLMNLERQIFLVFHKQIYCLMEEWYGKTLQEIIEMETKFFSEMNKKVTVVKEAERKLIENEKKDDKHIVVNSKEEEEGEDEEDDEEEEKEEKNVVSNEEQK